MVSALFSSASMAKSYSVLSVLLYCASSFSAFSLAAAHSFLVYFFSVEEVLLSLLLSPGVTSRCRTEYTVVSSNLGVPVLINR